MAQIKPFKALRFTEKAGPIGELVCPPYDIISEEERRAYLRQNPHNVIRLELPREGENPYLEAGRTLSKWEAEGSVAVDPTPAIYIYEEAFTAHGRSYAVKGFICRVKLEEFSAGVILPHEETLSKAKTDRFDLMQATRCNFSQIYSLYNDDGGCGELLDRLSSGAPDQELTDGDGVTHRLWIVPENAQTAELCRRFADKKLYIADGHHRYETALAYRRALAEKGEAPQSGAADYVMMCLVAMEHPGLVVFPTHRIVRGLDGFRAADVLEKCRSCFDLADLADGKAAKAALDAAYAAGKKAFALYSGRYTLLTLRDSSVMEQLLPDASPALRGLDVSVLHTLVLERLFGIDKANMAAGKNLVYTRDEGEAVAAVDSGAADCAFLLNPTRVEEIRDVAAAGEKMPQKSTYFYPKLITGMVMNALR